MSPLGLEYAKTLAWIAADIGSATGERVEPAERDPVPTGYTLELRGRVRRLLTEAGYDISELPPL
jgi:hypothetical protein